MGARVFGFPNPVNVVAARAVATGVVTMAAVAIATRQLWITIPLAYGFVARVLTGPRLSSLGFTASRVVAPRLTRWEKLVPGTPKRFAQGIGAAFGLSALGLWLSGAATACVVVLAVLLVPATLEAALGYCVGCKVFAFLIRAGLIPASVCDECENISSRPSGTARHSRRLVPEEIRS